MFERCKKYWLFLLVILLLVANIFIFYLDWQDSHRNFTFAMLDVGQGDALFIESPTGTQILVDGGPPRKILNQLSRVVSPFDRSIDAIIITNPDADHIAGFLDVLKIYKVDSVFESGTLTDSKTYQNLKDEINKNNIPSILARRGMKLNLGGGVFIDILFPDRDVSSWSTNDGSIVARLTYGDTKIMLTGDASVKTEKIILEENSQEQLKSNILKVGHHGSRTSTSLEFLKVINPSYAFISDGKDNKYGHPHKEILDELNQFGAKVLRTDLLGAIIMKCVKMNACEINR
ncbi:MBL fold metallo-hydrolase [Candidatus Nomurabacteria bacterium CG_4_9_14_0_2_um_filter_32_10]|uniref:Hydrolase n=3 Tax=Candidatus Nomuraibacteriota TaxID=1752729 RepID=A0A2H0CHS7_9BACT|nr:MAG: hydrolase [Candidatus Nomurabacteria bacterium CG22_combo_CG10-13_8_21_14_all_32_8]PJC49563.1 MAG: MBL fold metallo-hydrolase [Candidatus Nomurabacteria bacterium CG_4_9_14_0_2_um_filter_32_10]